MSELSEAQADKLLDGLLDVTRTLASNVGGTDDLAKGGVGAGPSGAHEPKSFFTDPFQYLDHLGIGYKETPSELTYGTLKAMSERNPLIAAIIQTRQNQVASFVQRPRNKYSVGFQISSKNKKRKMTDGERQYCWDTEEFLLRTGDDNNPERDDLETFVRKIVRDTLRYDQVTFEIVPKYSWRPHSFYAIDAATVRLARPKRRKGGPSQNMDEFRKPKYVQVVQGRIVADYTENELAFGVRNPRTDLYVGPYGLSELEMLIMTVTAHLWAEEWNRNVFSQGSTTKGVFLVKGSIPPAQLDQFRRMWQNQVSGVANAWKTPILNADDASWMNLQPTNMEMGYQQWIEYLIKIATAIYQIDPSEINFDLRNSGQQAPMFMTTNEAQQQVSKDKGLNPLLRFTSKLINRHILSKMDDKFEFEFVGLDQKSEEQAIELRLKEVQNYKTLNEVREEEDLPPVKFGDVPLNPTYTAYAQQQEMAEQQQQQEGGEQGAGGPPGMGGGPEGDEANTEEQAGAQPPFGDEERDAGERMQRDITLNDGGQQEDVAASLPHDPHALRKAHDNTFIIELPI